MNNTANASLNTLAGLTGKTDSAYSPTEFGQIVTYLAANPGSYLQGTVYIDGTFQFTQSVNLGGNTGNVTLAVRGDLVVDNNITVTNRHDLSTVAGRRTPGFLVFGLLAPTLGSSNVCMEERANGSGRLIMCGGNSQLLILDGLLYTADGMFIGSQGPLDQVGAMYHENRGTSNPSYTNQNSTVVVRFDPLALSIFNSGIALVSWQQLK